MSKIIVLIIITFCASALACSDLGLGNSLSKCVAKKDSPLIAAKKGDKVDCSILDWNKKQVETACVADKDLPMLGAKKGDHIICDSAVVGHGSFEEQPHVIPEGYCVVYYTSGCSTCAVGWVYAKGARCENCLNCAN